MCATRFVEQNTLLIPPSFMTWHISKRNHRTFVPYIRPDAPGDLQAGPQQPPPQGSQKPRLGHSYVGGTTLGDYSGGNGTRSSIYDRRNQRSRFNLYQKKSTTASILLFSRIFARMQARVAHGSRSTVRRPTTILHPTPSPSPARIMALPGRPAPPSKQNSRNATLEPCTELNPIASAERCVGSAHTALGTA